MATISAVPVEEYLHTSYDPDREYVDGQLVERHVGEHTHSRLQYMIAALLSARERARRFRGFTEQRVRVSEQRYRIPDLCVKALPYTVTPVLSRPDLVIEILSPDDEVGEMLVKIADFIRAGIPHIWIIDPYKRVVTEADQHGTRQVPTMLVETPLVGAIDFAPLFQQLDEPAE
jgi:Uma2 family endonuclease